MRSGEKIKEAEHDIVSDSCSEDEIPEQPVFNQAKQPLPCIEIEEERNDVRCYVKGVCNSTKKRKWDKNDVCFFCKEEMRSTSLGSHLLAKHGEEEKVKEILTLPKNSLKRKNKLQCLRNVGNFVHNNEVLKSGGEIIPVQRPSDSMDITENPKAFSACNSCFGFYQTTELWRHRCPAKDVNEKQNATKKTGIPALALGSTTAVKQFLNRMRYDELGMIIINDETIMRFVKNEMNTRGIRLFSTASSQARLLAEYLKYVNDNQNKTFTWISLLRPCNFDILYDCLLKMFDYDSGKMDTESIPKMARPSSFKRLIQTLFKISDIIRIFHLTEMKNAEADEQKVMQEIMQARLNPLATNAFKALKSATSGLPQELPQEEETLEFRSFLIEELKNAISLKVTEDEFLNLWLRGSLNLTSAELAKCQS